MRPPDPREVERQLARLDRRGFLRLTGAAAAAGLLPLGCGDAPPGLRPPEGLTLKVLTPRTYATFEAAAERLVGPAARARLAAPSAGGPALAARADARLVETPAFAGLVQQALLALEFGVWPLVPKLRPFTSLDADGRDAVLAGLATGRFDLSRALFQGVRSFTWLAWYADARSHPGIHYPGPFGDVEAHRKDAMTYPVDLPERGAP